MTSPSLSAHLAESSPMNSSQFMDKQILGLAASSGAAADFLDLDGEHRRSSGGGGVNNEDIIASYDFQPIRVVGSSPTSSSVAETARSGWGSVDTKLAASNLKYAGIPEPHELTKVCHEKERVAYDAATVAEIERTVKKYVDQIIHSLDDVSSRLSQMETRTHHLESSVDELKVVMGNCNGTIDGKLRQLQNVLREVQTGVQVLRDKQEIAETQLQLAKLQTSEGDRKTSESSNTGQLDSRQTPALSVQQSVQRQLQPPVASQPIHNQPPLPPPQQIHNQPPLNTIPPPQPIHNQPPLPPPQQIQAPAPFAGQLPQNQAPSPSPYLSSPAQLTETPHQQYQIPSHQHQQVPPQPHQSAPQFPHLAEASQQQYQIPSQQHQLPPPQTYQSAPPLPQYPQPPQPSQLQLPQQPHNPEDSTQYAPPPQSYPPSIRQQPASPRRPGGSPQQFYGPNPGMYEPSTSRLSSGQLPYSAGYGQQQGPPSFSDPYPYGGGSPSHYSSSQMKPSPFASSNTSSGGGSNNYQRLPTAQILPQAQPTGPPSAGSGNRVPVDDVVDKVVTMGFSRDVVRATVRKLTENGQSVDLNVVLDKLMNDGGEMIQPQKGWFGR